MKTLLQVLKSRTVTVAIGQAVGGILILVLTEMDMAGYVILVKSLMDIFLRIDTTKPISEL